MKQSFNNLLETLEPFIPRELVTPDVWAMIRNTATRLPAVYHGGLECRLTSNDNRVDLHQYILHDQEEPELLMDHIRRCNWEQHPGWRRIECICRQWRQPGTSLHRWVSQVWLEFDIHGQSDNIPSPSVFLQLRPLDTETDSIGDLFADVLKLLEPLIPRTDRRSLLTALLRSAQHCPAGAGITHIGLMLSRKPSPIRINVKNLAASEWAPFLQTIKWPGPLSELSDLIDPLYDKTDQLVFCLDIGDRVLPDLGLECLVAAGLDRRSAWESFLEDLVESKMASSGKRDAVLNWGRFIKPPDAAQLWPEDLIADSLLRGPERFSLISQEINHAKISYHPSRPPEAKAYLWFGHVWVSRQDVESSLAAAMPGVERRETDDG